MSDSDKGVNWTVFTGIAAAFVAFIGNLVVTYVQAQNTLALETQRHESELVNKAITDDLPSTRKMLKFYVDTGLIHNDNLAHALKDDQNIPTLISKGALACYSHYEKGSSYAVSSDIFVMGIVEGIRGKYVGRIFQPQGFEGKDISAENQFKALCNSRFPACESGCWAGGDTGGMYGYQ